MAHYVLIFGLIAFAVALLLFFGIYFLFQPGFKRLNSKDVFIFLFLAAVFGLGSFYGNGLSKSICPLKFGLYCKIPAAFVFAMGFTIIFYITFVKSKPF